MSKALSAPALTVLAQRNGYIQARDDEQLFQLAETHNLTVQLLREPGAFVTAGAPLARVWPFATPLDLSEEINGAFVLEAQRTLNFRIAADVESGHMDVALASTAKVYGSETVVEVLRQLVEIVEVARRELG